MSKKIKLAVVGATGVVGRMVLKVLEEANLPIDEYKFFASKRSAGTTLLFNNDVYLVNELDIFSFDEGFDFAIFSAGGDTALKYAPIAASKGCTVIDNSSAFRMDPSVPLVVPEVNCSAISSNDKIIANPNCSTIQAVVPLKALDDTWINRIEKVSDNHFVSSYEYIINIFASLTDLTSYQIEKVDLVLDNDELIIKLIDEDTIYGPMTITNVNKTKIPSFANNPKIY